MLPPVPHLAICDEAAADSTVPKPRWPPARHTVQLSPGGTRPSPDTTVHPSHRTDPLHGTAPSPGGPGREEGDSGYIQLMKEGNHENQLFLQQHQNCVSSQRKTHIMIAVVSTGAKNHLLLVTLILTVCNQFFELVLCIYTVKVTK